MPASKPVELGEESAMDRCVWALGFVVALVACSKQSQFPPLPPANLAPLVNVQSVVRADNVSVTFDPVDGAKDYRIYPVPTGSADAGMLGKIYRCAGNRPAPSLPVDNEPLPPSGAMKAYISHDVRGYTRSSAQVTLGYVWNAPGAGRIPVYALGDPAFNGDNPCYFMRWDESRVKKYVIDSSQRQSLIAAGWRDFGIPFYAPAAGAAGTVLVFTAVDPDRFGGPMYFADAQEQAARASLNPTAAFAVLAAAEAGTVPLKRVYYSNVCGAGHDELVAGEARFQHALRQGNTPVTSLLWTGLKGPTTLAVEALDSGCPFQGHLSPVSFSPMTLAGINHQAFLTLDQVGAADPNSEIFVNGQHDGEPRPKAISRSYIQVEPAAVESLDFHESFDADTGPYREVPPTGLYATKHFQSARYDISVIAIEEPLFTWGNVLGEFSVTYADKAADTNGKFRLAPFQKATMSQSSFLHVTAEVDAVTSSRRYPQILISNLDPPLQLISPVLPPMASGVTLIVQTFGNYPARLDIEVCDHRDWDVNNQCPRYTTDWATDTSTAGNQPPVPLVGELGGVDRRVRFDVWASTQKVYVMLDGQPMACANLAVGVPAGPASVTFGDVLYHSAADLTDPPNTYNFHNKHMLVETRRHFDELGFKSGVSAPAWDESKVPCASTTR
jgi:hypothetical protein